MTQHMTVEDLIQTFDSDLMCFLRDISICAKTGVGVMLTHGDSGPDMAACIDRFIELDPDIQEIRVVNCIDSQAVPDMCYRRIDGEWRAFQYLRTL